ncbi:hypothetical protein M5K25_006321 [Dendrobium thyrsiflorum]|uniref:Uncharacterized protein n=1 Tax=Dendrobium thyrsiflorum TaxID=117978 RepID=A0ABD0VCI4_DENTH
MLLHTIIDSIQVHNPKEYPGIEQVILDNDADLPIGIADHGLLPTPTKSSEPAGPAGASCTIGKISRLRARGAKLRTVCSYINHIDIGGNAEVAFYA